MAGSRKSAGAAGKRSSGGAAASGRSRGAEWLRRGLIGFVVLSLVSVLAFLALYMVIDIPDPNREFTTEQSEIYYADGKTELGRFAVQRRDAIPLSDMPDHLKNAVVAAENRTFWEDEGIDPRGIVRAIFSNASGENRQGASTITQQYVKILYLTQEQTYTRKVKEAILALKVGREQSKQEILQGYLNTIYFGRGAYGVQTAAKAYFDKDAKDLNLKEAAYLAAVIKNPNGYDPAKGREYKQALKPRYAYVLNAMAQMEHISASRAQKAARVLPKFPKIEAQDTYGGQRGHVMQLVREELSRLGFSQDTIEGGGLQITTTFTKKAMDAAEQGVLEARPDGFGDKELHIGVASVEPGTGALRGIYGGQNYLDSQINWAVAGGQAGSTFKAFALPAAIESGMTLRDTFNGNNPYTLPDGSTVGNQGSRSYGTINMTTATANSVNTAFIDMTLKMENGPEKIVEMANKMGIPPSKGNRKWGFPTRTGGLDPFTGVSLGPQTVSPINMANGYATIAAGGEFNKPYVIEKVVNPKGETVYSHKERGPKPKRAFDDDVAADVSFALQQVVKSGSGTAAQALGRPAAGKTGTATRDDGAVSSAWFTGYTPQLSTAVMYVRGKGNGQLDGWLPTFFGGEYPARTWTSVMQRAMEGLEVEDFPPPVYVARDTADGYAPPPPPTTRTPSPSPTKTAKPSPTEEPTTEKPTPKPTKTKETKPTDTGEPTVCEIDPDAPNCDDNNSGGNNREGDAGRSAGLIAGRWSG